MADTNDLFSRPLFADTLADDISDLLDEDHAETVNSSEPARAPLPHSATTYTPPAPVGAGTIHIDLRSHDSATPPQPAAVTEIPGLPRRAPAAAHATPHPAPALPPTQPVPAVRDNRRAARANSAGADIDWHVVAQLRERAAAQLVTARKEQPGLDRANERELTRSIANRIVGAHLLSALDAGDRAAASVDHDRLVTALFDELTGFGGRLQPHVDNDDLENAEIVGYDGAQALYADGTRAMLEPVADSDDDLVARVQAIAQQYGRTWTESNPDLSLSLPGRVRLQATAWITDRPSITIRRHRFVDIDLDDLIGLGVLNPALVAFLRAALRARKSIMVAGPQGSGKTLLMRALCVELGQTYERICTIESERELFLHELPHRFPRPVITFEGRPGGTELDATGRRIGEVTLADLIPPALRHNIDRIVVGEVRGAEILAMLSAMTVGAGSLSTIHAKSAQDVVERIVELLGGYHKIPRSAALSTIARTIDLVVYINKDITATAYDRYVSEVVAIRPGDGDDGHLSQVAVFQPGPGGRAVVGEDMESRLLDELIRAGFDPQFMRRDADTWGQPAGTGPLTYAPAAGGPQW